MGRKHINDQSTNMIFGRYSCNLQRIETIVYFGLTHNQKLFVTSIFDHVSLIYQNATRSYMVVLQNNNPRDNLQ